MKNKSERLWRILIIILALALVIWSQLLRRGSDPALLSEWQQAINSQEVTEKAE